MNGMVRSLVIVANLARQSRVLTRIGKPRKLATGKQTAGLVQLRYGGRNKCRSRALAGIGHGLSVRYAISRARRAPQLHRPASIQRGNGRGFSRLCLSKLKVTGRDHRVPGIVP
jgi:hypothetical protein